MCVCVYAGTLVYNFRGSTPAQTLLLLKILRKKVGKDNPPFSLRPQPLLEF